MLDAVLHTERTAAALAPLLPLSVEGLVFAAGGRRLIDGIDLRLDAGPCTVIVGPNGAGKSLLLRLLHGLLQPSAGRVLWGGRSPNRAVRLRQAMVFQKPVLLRRSAAANMRFALRARGLRNGALLAQSNTWLERAGLRGLALRPARVLSGGEQQRLAIARALSREPEVLFLDEPTASLDPASILAIEALISQAHAAGTKIVLVTHDLNQARRLADEIVFLCNGRVEEQAPADDFLDAPRSTKARDFVAGRIVL
jgi:tungstate transport system ATP-binding protein